MEATLSKLKQSLRTLRFQFLTHTRNHTPKQFFLDSGGENGSHPEQV